MTITAVSRRATRPPVPAVRGLTWVTWRQHRAALAGVLVLLGGVALFMLFNGLAMHRAYSNLRLDSCGNLSDPGCATPLATFQQKYLTWADHLPHLVMLMPALIGVFVGAPLAAREFESGTFRFAWTLARSRVQWIIAKLVLLGTVLTAFALAFSALSTWWYGPFDGIDGRLTAYGAYEITGLVFAARTLFAFTLGALLGVLMRRTVPAMAATAAAWLAVVLPSMIWLRPLIQKSITVIGAIAKGRSPGHNVPNNATVINHWFEDAAGHHVAVDRLFQQAITANHGTLPTPDQFSTYTAQHHYSGWVSYRPNNMFWHFQTVEASGYLIVAIALAVATVLVVRRKAV